MDTSRFEIDENGTARLQTTKGVLMMDAADLAVLSYGHLKYKRKASGWYADLYTYGKKRKRIGYVARLIMEAPSGMEVDHINHDTLDNRRCNLRICTRSENRRNGRAQRGRSSRFKGVTYHDARRWNPRCSGLKPWRAFTRVHGKRIELGYYATDVAAAMAYNRYAAAEFREFACFNRFETCPVLTMMFA